MSSGNLNFVYVFQEQVIELRIQVFLKEEICERKVS